MFIGRDQDRSCSRGEYLRPPAPYLLPHSTPLPLPCRTGEHDSHLLRDATQVSQAQKRVLDQASRGGKVEIMGEISECLRGCFFFFCSKGLSYHCKLIQRTELHIFSPNTRLSRRGFRRLIQLINKKGGRTGRKGREGMKAGPSQIYSIEMDESKIAY